MKMIWSVRVTDGAGLKFLSPGWSAVTRHSPRPAILKEEPTTEHGPEALNTTWRYEDARA